MKIKSLILAMAGAFGLAAAAHAATTDFSTIGANDGYNGPGGYSDGGVTVTYVGSPGSIWTTSQPAAPSGYSWYPDGGSTGYTDISPTGGGTFTSATLLAGSGWYGGSPQLDYALVDNGTILATGDWGTVPTFTGFLTAVITSSSPITDLWVQAPSTSTSFSASNYEALALGQITLNAGAVPEPASWSLMLAGFALTGYALRQRSGSRSRRVARAFG